MFKTNDFRMRAIQFRKRYTSVIQFVHRLKFLGKTAQIAMALTDKMVLWKLFLHTQMYMVILGEPTVVYDVYGTHTNVYGDI